MANYKLPKDHENVIDTVSWKRLKYAPYSQACIMIKGYKWTPRGYFLISYSTPIVFVDIEGGYVSVSEYVDCTATTRMHVNRFCKEMNDMLGTQIFSYQYLKSLKNMTVSYTTGEVLFEDNSDCYCWNFARSFYDTCSYNR